MIFKRLFRPKHQDPNPQVRIQAISALQPDNAEHKSHLHELAFNDEDAGVSLAALSRLDSFALWSKMSEIAKQDRVKKKAQAVVEDALFTENGIEIDLQDKRTFILECKNNGLLEKCLQQTWIKDQDTELALNILERLDKPHLTKQFLFSTNNVQLQLTLLENIDDESILNKVVKRLSDNNVQQLAKEKLAHIALCKRKPKEVEQKITLILSRLLALKDKTDFPLIRQSRTSLESEYCALQDDLAFLDDAKQQTISVKYQDISRRLDEWLAELEPEWEKQNKLTLFAEQFDALKTDAAQVFEQISQSLENDASQITIGQVETFEGNLQQLKKRLQDKIAEYNPLSTEMQSGVESLFNKLNSSNATLQRLPEFQHAIEQAKQFLDKFAALNLPTEQSQIEASEEYLRDLRQQWTGMTQDYRTNWPTALGQRWSEHHKAWKNALKEIKNALEKDFAKCKNKLRAVDSLIEQGKYKAAMGLYQKVQAWYSALPDSYQGRISRQFEKTKESIENLKDWQEYVAQPRKPALLDEINGLLDSPLEVDEQATVIKRLRKAWNSLGKLQTEADDALNDAFEVAIEAAFEPCRKHYEAQNLERSNNSEAKKQVIQDLQTLAATETDDKTFLKTLAEYQQRWRNIGEVGYKEVSALREAYSDALSSHKVRRQTLFNDYAEQKQKLIDKANSLLLQEDIFDAVQQVKELQSKWKSIPKGAHKKDNQLWQRFREVNDSLFAKRTEQQAEVRQIHDDLAKTIETELAAYKSSIESAEDKTALSELPGLGRQIDGNIQALPRKLQEKYRKQLNDLQTAQATKGEQIDHQHRKQIYINIFDALKAWNEQDLPEEVNALPNQWRQCFKQAGGNGDEQRNSIVIKMEIVSDQDSPTEDNEKRQEIQLQLMANKLQKGDSQNLDSLLKQFIGCGPTSARDSGLMQRVEKLFNVG